MKIRNQQYAIADFQNKRYQYLDPVALENNEKLKGDLNGRNKRLKDQRSTEN